MILSRAQRCSAKRLVVAAPSASANAATRVAMSAAPAPPAATEYIKRRRFMAIPPCMFSTTRLVSGETRRVAGESRALPRAETACPLPRNHIATAALMSREARTRASPCLRWDRQSILQLEALNLCVTLRADALRLEGAQHGRAVDASGRRRAHEVVHGQKSSAAEQWNDGKQS